MYKTETETVIELYTSKEVKISGIAMVLGFILGASFLGSIVLGGAIYVSQKLIK